MPPEDNPTKRISFWKDKKLSDETRRKMSETHKRNGTGKWMLGRHPSLESRKKMSESRRGHKHSEETLNKLRGANCHLWKGGITPEHQAIRTSLPYKVWRKEVYAQKGYVCLWCGTIENLQVDHIKPFAFYPELRFSVENGRVLCKTCHIKTDTFGRPKATFV